jgi:sialic acid synthase SpsE
MVTAIRRTEDAIGDSYRYLLPAEDDISKLGRRSLVSTRNIHEGEIIEKEDITLKRPGTGIKPEHIDVVIGRTAKEDIRENRVITWENV